VRPHDTDWHWVVGRCSACGSLTPEEAIRLLSTAGTFFASSDWAFGWPDVVHLDAETFHAAHLVTVDDHELAMLARLTAPTLGVVYTRDDEGKIDYRAVRMGFRVRGIVGEAVPPDGRHVFR
jgi:hypothetical protein